MARRKKQQKHWCLAYADLLEPLKKKFAPPGLELTDGQTCDIALAVVHEILIEDNLQIVDLDKLLAHFNEHLKKTWADFVSKALIGAGHEDVVVDWHKDGSVEVRWDGGRAIVPTKVFSGERMDKDDWLRQLKTGVRVS